jgi:hypothetical protein
MSRLEWIWLILTMDKLDPPTWCVGPRMFALRPLRLSHYSSLGLWRLRSLWSFPLRICGAETVSMRE